MCFHLHKDPLTARSTYLDRQLTELNEITLPLNITAETFALVADFCYGSHVTITPFNVAALRTAAELLGMTETNGRRNQNLKQITETYFRRVVTVNYELAMIVVRSCLTLLPEYLTLRSMLRREAAGREAVHLKAEMESTNSRIESLERELAGMRKLLKSERERSVLEKKLLEKSRKQGGGDHDDRIWVGEVEKGERSAMESSRSASFHCGSVKDARIERGERGATSFASSRLGSGTDQSPRTQKVRGKGLLSRLKSTLWVSSKRGDDRRPSERNGNGDDDDVDMLTKKIHLLTNGVTW